MEETKKNLSSGIQSLLVLFRLYNGTSEEIKELIKNTQKAVKNGR